MPLFSLVLKYYLIFIIYLQDNSYFKIPKERMQTLIYALNLCPCFSPSMSCKRLWIWQLSPRWKIMHLINCYSAEMSSQGKAVPQTQHLAFSFCLLCCYEANTNSEDLCRAGSRRAHCQKSITRALISCTDQRWPNSEKLSLQERQYNANGDCLSICT